MTVTSVIVLYVAWYLVTRSLLITLTLLLHNDKLPFPYPREVELSREQLLLNNLVVVLLPLYLEWVMVGFGCLFIPIAVIPKIPEIPEKVATLYNVYQQFQVSKVEALSLKAARKGQLSIAVETTGQLSVID